MNVGELLSERLWAADWRAMDDFLQGLDAEALELARETFRSTPPRDWQELYARIPDQGRHDDFYRGEQLALATLADTPKAALARTYWFHSWRWNDDWEVDGVILERLAARGKRWVAGFVKEAASGRVVGGQDLYPHLLALMVHFDLPQPPGKVYRETWSNLLTRTPHRPAREELHAVYARQREWSLDEQGRRVARTPTRDLPVIERMRREPHLAQLVRETLAAKRGMHTWDPKREDPVQGVLVTLVEEGVFTREELVEDAWAILGRLDTPSTHRAAADLLLRLVDTDELAASFPMLVGCLASVHGSVTSVLLGPAMEAARDEDDLLALCEVIFARTEKRQRADLLAVLTADSALARWSSTTVVACLRLAADVDDVQLSAAARKSLEARSDQTPAPVEAGVGDEVGEGGGAPTGLWREADPTEARPGPFVTLDGGRVVADAFQAAFRSGAMDTSVIDVFMRWARSDRPELERWLRSWVPRPEAVRESFAFSAALSRWTWDELGWARRHTMVDRVHHLFGVWEDGWFTPGRHPFPGDDPTDLAFYQASPIDGLLALLAQESLTRAGEVPHLLSAPSRMDGTIRFTDLVARIREYDGLACGPLDLFQVLLRLDPVTPTRLGELDGLVLPVWSDGGGPVAGQDPRDGVELVRRWVLAGGLPCLDVRFDKGHPTLHSSSWPDVLSAFPQVPSALTHDLAWVEAASYEVAGGWRDRSRRRDNREAILAFPHWPDLFAVDVEPLMSGEREGRVVIGQVMLMTGQAGPGRQHMVVSALNAKNLERRLEGVDAAIALVTSGRWNAQAHADVTVAYLHADRLGLARSASAWHQLALAGELKAIWPTILGVLDAGAVMPRKPVGYPEVLAVARKLIRAVPDPTLPQSLHDLAAAKGRTRTHLEARALVGEAR